jgi:DnaK suppressor protein
VAREYSVLRKKLEDERARLREEIEQLNHIREQGIDYGKDVADDAAEAFDATMNLALRESLEETLWHVEEALQRFEDGTYGICQNCGRTIELDRLKILPHAPLCAQCARRREKEGKAGRAN